MSQKRINLETSRRVDDTISPAAESIASTGSSDVDASILEEERRTSATLRQALTPRDPELHELQRRLQVAVEHLDASADASRFDGPSVVAMPRWKLVAGAAASFLVGASCWWLVFSPGPAGPERSSVDPARATRMVVFEGEDHVLETLPVSSGGGATNDVGLGHRIRRQRAILQPERDPGAPASEAGELAPREILLELEEIETRRVRLAPRPWQ